MKKRPLHLKIVLVLLFILIGSAFAASGVLVMNQVSKDTHQENVKEELLAEGRQLAAKISESGYYDNPDEMSLVNLEARAAANVLNAVIRAVCFTSDPSDASEFAPAIRLLSAATVSDTSGEVTGQLVSAWDEDPVWLSVISQGDEYYMYDKNSGIVTAALPVAEAPGGKVIGAVYISAQAVRISSLTRNMDRYTKMTLVIAVCALFPLSILLSVLITRPFDRLNAALSRTRDGLISDDLSEHSYDVTSKICDMVNGTIRRLKTIDESRDEFVANVSHELKTPITSIRILADSLLGMEELPQELCREFLKDISEEVDREAGIINNLLELVRLDKSAASISAKPVAVTEMIKGILRRIRPAADQKHVELVLRTIRDVSVEGDLTRLTTAFTNVIENAVKYNNNDGSVTIIVDSDHQNCYVTVRDTGIGIPEEYADRIFERFFRIDKARSRETGGTGLGLAITRNIIRLHHGSISVHNRKTPETESAGTDFVITIPLRYIPDNPEIVTVTGTRK